jgi:archaeosine synthase beta-subunit
VRPSPTDSSRAERGLPPGHGGGQAGVKLSVYPETATERDRWIIARRGERNTLDPWRPYAFLNEEEPGADGLLVPTATLFLTNRECPYRCLMCDLWQNTLAESVPPGAVAAQIRHALECLPPARQIKLYNAGSFFDPRAIPPAEDEEIARLCAPFERVIVECHPSFVGVRCMRFAARLSGTLEVAMGLETVHPAVLPRLNKRMTLDQFRAGAERLAGAGIALRVFVLLRPPWLSEDEGVEWAGRSLEFAFACGATACTVIPTRAGNGAMEALAVAGEFAPPALASLEAAVEHGLRLGAGRVFSDLWDVERFARCPACSPARIERLSAMNRTQRVPPAIRCAACGGPG